MCTVILILFLTSAEFQMTLLGWISSTLAEIDHCKQKLHASEQTLLDLQTKAKHLEFQADDCKKDLLKWEQWMKDRPNTADGVRAVIQDKEQHLKETVFPELQKCNTELAYQNSVRDATTSSLKSLEPRLQRFLACKEAAPFMLDPILPQIDVAAGLGASCPFCARSLIWMERPLPLLIAECNHQYHLPCLISLLR